MNRRPKLLLAIPLLLSGMAAAQTRKPLVPEDVYRLKAVSDPQVSPDGGSVVYVVTTIDTIKNKRLGSIWMVPADGSAESKPFIADIPARSPRWSPDGKWLAFLSNSAVPATTAFEPEKAVTPPNPPRASDARAQVWLVAGDGTGRRPLTHFAHGVSQIIWSPDGTRLAVVARVGNKNSDVKHYSSLLYKSDEAGLSDGTRSHVWVVDVGTGEARQVSTAADRDDNDPQWSPDGNWIAYVSEEAGPELRETSGITDILVVPAAGGEPRVLCDHHANVLSPHWSPDGKQIAYAASATPADQPLLWISSVANPSKPQLASDADLFPTEVEWDSTGLWFGARERGAAPLYRVDLATNHAAKVVAGERTQHELRISEAGRRLVYVANNDTHPPEVFTSDLDGREERQLTFQNREVLDTLQLSTAERLSWKSRDGLPIEGFLMRPLGWQAGQKYPMILSIHGGPNGMFGFHWAVDEQLYSANGYAVFTTNPRGSSGYGMRFQRAVDGEWGGKAYEDILSGVESVLTREPWIDRNRLGVVGHSYGGFMTNWIVTQTNAFRAAVSISGITDFISVEGTRDSAFGHSHDFGGDLFSNFDTYWKYSPLRLAGKVKTPILFLHGDADNRVPVSQSEEYFRAIKHFGGVADLVIFPRESHMLPLTSEPRHLVETYRWRLYWFDRFVNGNTRAMTPDASSASAANTTRPGLER